MNSIKFLLGILLLCGACQVPRLTSVNPNQSKLPSNFGRLSDATNQRITPKELLFKDPALIELIDSALVNNYDMQMVTQRIEKYRSGIMLTSGVLRPKVEAGGSSSLRRFGLYTMDGAGNITTEITPGQIVPTHLPDFLVNFQASWEVDLFGKLKNKKSAALNRFLASIEGRKWLQTTLISDISDAYFTLLAYDNEIDLLNEYIALQENALEIVNLQKEVGRANRLAIKQFEAQLLNLKSDKSAIENMIVETENQINFLVGRYPQPIKRNKDTLKQFHLSSLEVGLPAELLGNRSDLKEAELELKAAKLEVEVAKKAFYPSLNLLGGLGMQAFRADYLITQPQSFAYNLVGNLMGPVLNKSAIKADFSYANAHQLEMLYAYQKKILVAYYEVTNGIRLNENLEKIYQFRKTESDHLAEASLVSIDLFKSNRANYLELLLLQQNALQAQVELISVRKRQFGALIMIYKALGGGWN
jgi:NodT family efflux transporter outer membrane factor (OMF) lipoprotein